MSVLANQTNATPGNEFFLKSGASQSGTIGTLTVSSLNNISSINGVNWNGSSADGTDAVYGQTNTGATKTLDTTNQGALILTSTNVSFTFLSSHQYLFSAPVGLNISGVSGSGQIKFGVQPVVASPGLGLPYIAATPAAAGYTFPITSGAAPGLQSNITQTLTGNYFAYTTFSTPMCMYAAPTTGITAASASSPINTFANETLVIQDLGLLTQS